MTVTLINERKDDSTEFQSRAEAEDEKQKLIELGMSADNLQIVTETKADGGTSNATVVNDERPQPPENAAEPDADALDELGEELGTDPLSVLPSHMVDHIQGQPSVNKRGYAMIAERYGISVSADIITYPWENAENRCVAKATAITEDGKEYSGHGTACVDDGDMPEQIVELAETRSLKRAVSWASGVGIVGYQELKQELDQ